MYIKPRLHKTPVIVSEYLNGQSHWMNIKNFSDVEIEMWLEFLRTRSGYELSQLISDYNVSMPSVQGFWNPYLNRPSTLNGKTFPCQERGQYKPELPSATEQLLELSKRLKMEQTID